MNKQDCWDLSRFRATKERSMNVYIIYFNIYLLAFRPPPEKVAPVDSVSDKIAIFEVSLDEMERKIKQTKLYVAEF